MIKMSQKTTVIELFEAGKDYDAIEAETGAKRTYIRTIISQYKKALDAGDVEDEKSEQEKESEVNNESESMDFENDLEGENSETGDEMGDQKTGKEYHKTWVEAKAFECSCGCTLNRTSKFCPNCGVTLDWSGF